VASPATIRLSAQTPQNAETVIGIEDTETHRSAVDMLRRVETGRIGAHRSGAEIHGTHRNGSELDGIHLGGTGIYEIVMGGTHLSILITIGTPLEPTPANDERSETHPSKSTLQNAKAFETPTANGTIPLRSAFPHLPSPTERI
jgi:hypothetical protein